MQLKGMDVFSVELGKTIVADLFKCMHAVICSVGEVIKKKKTASYHRMDRTISSPTKVEIK
jgi:hypothetical protein